MPKKHASLPEANEKVIGGTLTPSAAAPMHQENAATVEDASSDPTPPARPEVTPMLKSKQPTKKKGRVQHTTYLAKDTLRRLEEVRYRLLMDYNVPANKSDIIEYALNEGLADLAKLAEALGRLTPSNP
jgi:hypothetical protein